MDRLGLPNQVKLPNDCLDDSQTRLFRGGVYSWQPRQHHPSRTSPTHLRAVSYLVVIIGTATGMAVSALVPPDGWDCRHIGEVLILIAWLLSAQADGPLSRLLLKEDSQKDEDHQAKAKKQRKLFWATAAKDLLTAIATLGGVITTQIGVFNRCSCYTLWGRTGLALPEQPSIATTLFHRITTSYPAITFTSISTELILIPFIISILHRDALRTFVQRDDRTSNAKWLWTLLKKYRLSKAKAQARISGYYVSLAKGKRTNTTIVEEGRRGDSNEMERLTQALSEEPESMAGQDSSGGVADGEAEANSQSSGVESPSRSGTTVQPRPEPRRRNTDRTRVTI